jgi:hypothetical protein
MLMVDGSCFCGRFNTTTLWRLDAGHRGRPPHQFNANLSLFVEVRQTGRVARDAAFPAQLASVYEL